MVSAINSFFAILTLGWPFVLAGGISMFQRTENVGDPALLVVGAALWTYPFLFMTTWFVSRRALHRHAFRKYAVPVALLPSLNLVCGVIALAWYWRGCVKRLIC